MHNDPNVMPIEYDLKLIMQEHLFEVNNEKLWGTLKDEISNFLAKLWNNGKLRGTNASQAFHVEIGKSTMTEEEIASGELRLTVSIATKRSGDFIDLQLHQKQLTAN